MHIYVNIFMINSDKRNLVLDIDKKKLKLVKTSILRFPFQRLLRMYNDFLDKNKDILVLTILHGFLSIFKM